jgi:exopolysaccharide biosynthesis polyprenyl glycosylphosphotransferase
MTNSRINALIITSKIVIDAVMVAVAFVLGYYMRIAIPFPTRPQAVDGFFIYMPMMVVQIISVILVFYANRLYHVPRVNSRIDEIYNVFGAVSIGTMMAVAISALTFKNSIFELDYPRAMIVYAWLMGILLIVLGRELHRRVWHFVRMRGVGRAKVLVVGSGEAARAIIQKIQWSPYLGYDLVGIVNGSNPIGIPGAPHLGTIDELTDVIDEHEVEEVIIALPEGTPRQEIVRIISRAQRGSTAIKVFPDVFEFITGGVTVDDLGGLPLLTVRDIQLRGWKLSLKRAMDLLVALVGLVVLSPVFLIIGLLIKMESPGPVFFCQERMGLDGRPFQVIKFRSMRPDAEKKATWTVANDPRRTRIGAWMRATNIDELPQLINVLLGEMSLVGPRPEQPQYVQRFRTTIPRYMERHREKAGMTGWAQINGLRGNTSIPERTKYDLWYVENWSLWLDIKILMRTMMLTVTSLVSRNGDDHNAY